MLQRSESRSSLTTGLEAITVLRRRLQVQRVVYGVLCTLIVCAVAVSAVSLIDYATRPRAEALRAALSVLALMVVVGAIWRWLLPAVRDGADKVSAARRLEQHYPQLDDRISSAVALAGPSADDAGSAALRAAALRACERELEHVDVTSVVDYRPVRRVAGTVLVLVALGAVFATPRLPVLRTALARIVFPLRDHEWPRQIHLDVVHAPRRLAAGADWHLRVVERNGRVPRDAVVCFRERTGSTRQQTVMPLSQTPEAMTAFRPRVTRSFEFRVRGGDDRDMPWQRVDVVPPPRVVAFDVTVFPPAYARSEPQSAPPNPLVLPGTGIRIEGQSSRPLERLSLVLESAERVPARVAANGRSFEVDADEFRVERSGTYRFELVDRHGLVSLDPQRYHITVQQDPPPRIRFVEPDEGLVIRPHAKVPLHIVAEDNLYVDDMILVYRQTGDSVGDEQGDEQPVPAVVEEPAKAPHGDNDRDPARVRPARRTLRTQWDVSFLGLSPGDDLIVAAVATDARPGSTGSRAQRRLSVVGDAQWNRWILQWENRVRRTVSDAIRVHDAAMQAMASVSNSTQGASQRESPGRGALERVSRLEGDVRRLLSGSEDSVVAQIDDLMRTMRISATDDATFPEIWPLLRRRLSEIGEQKIVKIQYAINAATRAMEAVEAAPVAEPSTLDRQWKEIRFEQEAVARELAALLERLAVRTARQEVADSVRGMREEHEQILRQVAELAEKLLAGDAGVPDESDAGALKRLADRYLDMARRLAASTRAENSGVGTAGGSTAAAPAGEALAAARQLRRTARYLERRQLGRAIQQQARVTTQLERLMGAAEQTASGPPPDRGLVDQTAEGTAAVEKPEDLRDRVRARLPSEAARWFGPWPDAPFVPRYRQQTEAYFRRLAEEP